MIDRAMFAFAVTLLVIPIDGIPKSYGELLYIRALKASGRLLLSKYERISTRGKIASFLVLSATGLVSALFATVFPPNIAVFTGFIYMTLPVTMPFTSIYYGRKAKRAAGGGYLQTASHKSLIHLMFQLRLWYNAF